MYLLFIVLLRFLGLIKRVCGGGGVPYLFRFIVDGNGYYRRWPFWEHTLRYEVALKNVCALFRTVFNRRFRFLEWVALGSGRCLFMALTVVFFATTFYLVPTLAVMQLHALFYYAVVLRFFIRAYRSPLNPIDLMGLLFWGFGVGALLGVSAHITNVGFIVNPSHWCIITVRAWLSLILDVRWYLHPSALHYWVIIMNALVTLGTCRSWQKVGVLAVPRWLENAPLPTVPLTWLSPRKRRCILWWAGRVDRYLVGSLSVVYTSMFFNSPVFLGVWGIMVVVVYFPILCCLRSEGLLYRKACAVGWTGLGPLLVCKLIASLLITHVLGPLLLSYLGKWAAALAGKIPTKGACRRGASQVRLYWKVKAVNSENGFRVALRVTQRKSLWGAAKKVAKKAAHSAAKGGPK